MNYNNKTAEQFFNELKLDDKVKVYHRIHGTDSYEWLDGIVIGFKIAKAQKFQNHSVFYYAVKSRKQILPQPTFKKNKNDYLLMIKFYKNKIKKINQMIKKHDGNIYIFGAHVFSQFLINFGLEINRISYVLDNSYLKTNQRLYGYNLHIKKPEIIKKDFKPLIIAIVGQYKKEINSQIKSLNKSAKIIN